ncbi:hypothetical protein P4639_22210 [Priestia megaterium]|uniref:hypothetical protein n=1 Tax=Priestia megaterium TaxID=1404 RepID=UPI002E1A40C7|nr:hypothetical protein [Priestia megaterium]
MKGLLKLEVEIDYNEMLSQDKLEALHGFTGKKTPTELAQHHMDYVGEKVSNIFKDLPHVRYEVKGEFVDEQKTFGDIIREVEQNDFANLSEATEEVEDEEQAVKESYTLYDMFVRKLDEALEKASTEVGMPTLIKASGDMIDAIKSSLSYFDRVESDNGVISKYNGFPIVQEGMDELFIIDCKSYIDQGEILTVSQSKENL